MVARYPDRFVAFASVALQFPEMAAEQLEQGVKKYYLRGAAMGGHVNGDELSNPKFDLRLILDETFDRFPRPEDLRGARLRVPAVLRSLLRLRLQQIP